MKFKFKYYLKQYLNFSRKDRNGIIVLSCLIVIFIAANFIANFVNFDSESDFSEIKNYLSETELEKAESEVKNLSLFPFNPNSISPEKLDLLLLPTSIKKNLLRYRNSGGKFYSSTDIRKLYGMNDSIFAEIESYILIHSEKKIDFERKTEVPEKSFKAFDPNKVEYEELVSMGFSKFQAKNIVEFRNKRGFFKVREDLLKIYGIDSGFYMAMKNYITIDLPPTGIKSEPKKEWDRIELNSCNSSDLEELKGIGEVLASRIIKYRDLLGGFNSQNQLLEVYGLSGEIFDAIKSNVYTDTLIVKKIRINFFGMSDLPRHPYIKPGQFKSILNYRDKKGPYTNTIQLLNAQLIDSVTFKRIEPYITCR